MPEPARWLPDPYGRYQQRYFDGTNWTAHVFSDGEQRVDPLGATLSIPFAVPTSAPTAGPPPVSTALAAEPDGAATSRSTTELDKFLDALGPDARTRAPVRLSIALAGAGGAAAAAGIASAIVGDDDNRVRLAIAAVVIVGIAYAIRLGVKSQPEMRSAAVGAAIVGIPGLALAATGDETGGGTLMLTAALLLAAWALPGMRGRPLMLGAGAVALVSALTTLGDDTAEGNDLFDFADIIGGMVWLFVVAAIVLLAMVWWLDAHGYHGVGTSLVVAAILASALAVVKVVADLGSTGAALLLALAGHAVALVGNHGGRRASTWFGVAVAAIGTVAVFASAFDPDSTGDLAATFILAGLVLIAAPAAMKAVQASRRRPSSSGGSGALR